MGLPVSTLRQDISLVVRFQGTSYRLLHQEQDDDRNALNKYCSRLVRYQALLGYSL